MVSARHAESAAVGLIALRTCSSSPLRLTWLLVAVAILQLMPGCRVLGKRDPRVVTTSRELSLRGFDALQLRKYSEAESLFAEALRQSPNDERAQWGYAEVLWHRKSYRQAIAHMSQAVVLSSSNPDLQVRLGQMYLEQEDFAAAEKQAEAALRSRRHDPAAWALKADVMRCRGQWKDAINCYQLALVYRPDWPEVQITLAELYRNTSDPQRALATLDRITDLRSDSQLPPRVFLVRGQALADLGQQEAALLCLRQSAPRLADDQSELLVEYARTQFELGDLVEARISLGRALQSAPENSVAIRLQSELDQAFAGHNDPNVSALMISTPVNK